MNPKNLNYMTRRQIADYYGVRPGAVTRWAREGRIEVVRTPGGQRRYRLPERERKLLEAGNA